MIELQDQINKFKNNGEEIIMMEYINEYVQRKRIQNFFAKFGTRKIILEINVLNGPATTRPKTI